MKLIEGDPSLVEICQLVETRLESVSCLATVEISVLLLKNFQDLRHPVTPRNPTAYNQTYHKILVNAEVFPSLSAKAAQFALAHEIGHHAHDTGISASLLGSNGVHPCLIADWLATQWGFAEERELYAARCAVVHTFTPESTLSKRGKARVIGYAYGEADVKKLDAATVLLGRQAGQVNVHIKDLIEAFQNGYLTYLREALADKLRREQVLKHMGMWSASMAPDKIDAFLEVTSANPRPGSPKARQK